MKRQYWTDETCIEIAKQYTNITQFQKDYPGCYKYAVKHNLIDTFDWFIRDKVKRGFWSYENCYNEAKKYTTRNDFKKYGGTAYNKSCINGWLKDYVWLEYKTKPNGYWNVYENCLNEAKKCHSRHEFYRLTTSGYVNSIKNGWIDDFTWLNNPILKDYDEIKENVYIIYAYFDIENQTVYVGLTNNIKERHSRHNRIDKRRNKYSSAKEYFISIGKELPIPKILEKNLNVIDAQKQEEFWINYYKENGWTILNKAKTGIGKSSIGGGFIKWNYDRCYNEAKKYKSIVEMQRKSHGAYRNALKFGWLKEYTWFITYSKPKNYWDYNHCKEEAKKYKSRSELSEKCNGAYRSSRLNKWLDEFYPKNNK